MTVYRPEKAPQPAALDEFVDQLLASHHHRLLDLDVVRWQTDLQTRLVQIQQHPEQGLGFIEETIRQSTLELQRALVQQAMQIKADAAATQCPDCHHPLRNLKRRVARQIDSYCGQVRLERTHGWCPRCARWHFPADRLLGLRADAHASPLMQELAALLVAKMPAEQAEALAGRVLGRALSRSTLARHAHAQGEAAIELRQRLLTAPVVGPPPPPAVDQPPKPFTLVIQLDAWNIRERDHWGQTENRRRRQEPVERWHWVYTATCFRLDQRGHTGTTKDKQRAVITERSYVATRGGLDDLLPQLYYEARVRGLAQAERVLVIADGAVWIWKLVADRFPQAIERLDLFHANTYLWAVAKELHGDDPAAARQWVKPLLRQVRHDQVARVVTQLEDLKPSLTTSAATTAVDQTITYYQNNQARMRYKEGRRRNEPLGSGAIESTCRQLQCRLKRCGQFWSTAGDEALLALEMLWRNQRWELLFPHAKLTAVANN